MNKKIISIGFIFCVTAFLLFSFSYVSFPQAEDNLNGSLVTFYNNGTSWMHIVAIFENVTFKNGSLGSVSTDLWLEPKTNKVVKYSDLPGHATVYLSNLTGYGNDSLPEGTKINLFLVVDNLNQTSGGIDYPNLIIIAKKSFNSSVKGLGTISVVPNEILKLPEGINTNHVETTTDPTEGAEFLENMNSQVFEYKIYFIPGDGINLGFFWQPRLCSELSMEARILLLEIMERNRNIKPTVYIIQIPNPGGTRG